MKKILLFFFLTSFLVQPSFSEWMSIEGRPAQWEDIIKVKLKDLRPTQPAVGFDRLYYKLGRYEEDPRKVYDEYCETMGQKGIKNFSNKSHLQDPATFECLERIGLDRSEMKTVVIGPDNNLYLTDGHHTFDAYWHVNGGGPELDVYVIVARDYRRFDSMSDFWRQLDAEKNIWLFDPEGNPITPDQIPTSLGLNHALDDKYRSLLYFTKRVAWTSPGDIEVPDAEFLGDTYADMPFVEFYWAKEIQNRVDLSKFDLDTHRGYVKAMKAVGEAILNVDTPDVGGSGKPPEMMGQFKQINSVELARLSRPGTGKIAHMIKYKKRKKDLLSANIFN